MEQTKDKTLNEVERKETDVAGIQASIDRLNERNEELRPVVDEVYNMLSEKVTNGEMTILDIFNVLSKVTTYTAQSFFDNKEEFDNEFYIARKLVSENVIQALGINAENEELNKSSIVEFKGEHDNRNFSISRIMLLASQIIDYSLWQLELTGNMKKEIAKQEATK